MTVLPLPKSRPWLVLYRLLRAGCLLPLGWSAAVSVQAQTAPEPVERLIIQYRPEAQPAGRMVVEAGEPVRAAAAVARVSQSASLARITGLRYLKSVSPRLHVAQLDHPLPASQAQALVDRLMADPAVASVTVDRRLRSHALPTDLHYTLASSPYYQWHLQSSSSEPGAINAAQAWASSTGTGVVVAVLDGGYRPHADLAANLLTDNDYDFVSDVWTANDGDGHDADARDPGDWIAPADATASCPAESSSWHGTHVAGLVGALANNGDSGVGVAYGAKVQPVRVLGRCGGYLSDILAAARWAAGLSTVSGVAAPTPRARVLSLSLGVDASCDGTTQSVIDEIRAEGVSVVASTGNDGLTAITQPANCMGVVAVTAHTRSGRLASYANVGPGVALSAPGGDEWDPVSSTSNLGTTVPLGDAHALMHGTSMAVPQVAGVLALMASARPDLAQPTLEALMREDASVRAFPAGSYCATNPSLCGAGLLDAGRAVARVMSLPLGPLADLEVLQRATASSWAVGSPVELTIQVRNWGDTTATAVALTAALTGLDIVSVSATGLSYSASGGQLSVVIGDLAPDGQRVLTVHATVATSDPALVSSAASTTSGVAEATLKNNVHRLDPSGVVSTAGAEVTADSGGGCTVAPAGQADMGLPLLALVAALGLIWRRRQPG